MLPSTPTTPTPPPTFQVLYADPPWRLGGSGKASPPYPMMATRDICALPVRSLAAPDCALLLWAVHSHLPDALAVIRAWGFEYKTVAFTWVKRTPLDTGFFLGRGYWTHSNAEPCLLAIKGKPKRFGTGVPSLVVSPRREHSRKPDEVRQRIVRVFGDVPRAELFARQKVPGWSAWGNEVECDFSLCSEDCCVETAGYFRCGSRAGRVKRPLYQPGRQQDASRQQMLRAAARCKQENHGQVLNQRA